MHAGGQPVSSRADPPRADLEDITSAWVTWCNACRLMRRLGRIPHRQKPRPSTTLECGLGSTPVTHDKVRKKPGTLQSVERKRTRLRLCRIR